MAKRGREGRTTASAWLLKDERRRKGEGRESGAQQSGGPKGGATSGRAQSRETRQWRAFPKPSKNDGPEQKQDGRTGASRRSPVRRGKPRERSASLRLRRAQRKLRAQEELIEEMRERLAASERQKPNARPAPQQRPRRAAKGGRSGKLDVNSATFEQLRDLGLSVTQSARLIAYRDMREGFDSLDDLDEIPGFSRTDLQGLHEKLVVESH